jgi:hypothetical protein
MAGEEVVGTYSLAVLLLLQPTLLVSKTPIMQNDKVNEEKGKSVDKKDCGKVTERTETCCLPSSAQHPTQAFFFVEEEQVA